MKRKLLLLLIAALLATAFTACDTVGEMVQVVFGSETPTPAPTATPVPTPTPEPTPEPTPTPTPSPTPRIPRSNTSGKVLEGDEVYQPTIISIENHQAARPQSGLMNADIVYEFLVEANYTRFQAVFSDDFPALAGPVRSARYYFLDLVEEWDALYGFQGYVQLLDEYRRRLSDYPMIQAGHTKEFKRVSLGASKVHSLYVYLSDFVENNYGDHAPEREDRFYFSDVSEVRDGVRVESVQVPFTKLCVIDYTYDAEQNAFARYQDGEVFSARMPDPELKPKEYEIVPVTVKNLILQFCEYGKVPASAQPGSDKNRRSVQLTGSGKCAFFIDGQYVPGTWERASLDDHTTYRLENGELVTLLSGNTWIEVLPDDAQWSYTPTGDGAPIYPNGAPEGVTAEEAAEAEATAEE